MKRAVAFLLYALTIPLANWFIGHVGTVSFPGGPHTIPVGFGYSAPSGVLFIGVALVARDVLQRVAGKCWALVAIAVGIVLSAIVNPTIAFASATAFALGELFDFAVYTPLADRSRRVKVVRYRSMFGTILSEDRRPYTDYGLLAAAVIASGLVGSVIDSLVFLQLAFGSLNFWQGQVLAKVAISVLAGVGVLAYGAVSHRQFAKV